MVSSNLEVRAAPLMGQTCVSSTTWRDVPMEQMEENVQRANKCAPNVSGHTASRITISIDKL